jgi:hypothetical protein
MSQPGDVGMPKGRNPVFIHGRPRYLRGVPICPFGVFEGLPGMLVPGLVILLFMSFRGAAMCVGRIIVQLGSSLMILVMRSVVITSRHL